MRENRKRFTACLVAAAMASSAVAGCQRPGASSGENPGTGESFVTEAQVQVKEADKVMEGRKEKGKSVEAEEPKKAELSPEDYEGWNRLLSENKISEDFGKGLDRFAYESGSMVLKDARGNVNYSPLSLYYTLALAGCGARGETADQILEKLEAKDTEELADQCRRLYQWYVYHSQQERERMAHYGMDDYRSTIRLGNSLWISHELPVYQDYQKVAAENFFASSYGVDFGNTDTGKRMGEWIAEKTNGVLAPQIYVNPATLLVILNTLYFYGGWAEPFSEEMTREDVFYPESGGQLTVPYLNRTQMEGAFKKGDGYTLSYLGTNNGCRMVFLLPDEGREVGKFLESPESLRAAMEVKEDDWVMGKVIWKVPKFDFGSSFELNEALTAMGMDRMFDGRAEFGGISPDPLMVSSVIQQTHIGVDENGVEGAAFTMMALAKGAMIENEELAEMILDRPFLFGIRDDSCETWLFLGVCREPEGEMAGSEKAGGSREEAGSEKAAGNRAENDLLLTSAPEIRLHDALSSTMEEFSVKSGNYSWRWLESGKMKAVEACGSHPLDIDPQKTDILKIPNYNRLEEVSYILNCTQMPQSVTVREWDISQLGKAEAAEPSVKVYYDSWLISLKRDKVYELVAEWPSENLEEQGFSGEASYVVVTD